jgi:hypothetical protein
MGKTGRMMELRIWLGRELYERVSREAAIRGISLSAVVRTCLQEYFALRDELASSIEDDTGGQGIRTPSKTLHLLIAHSEARIRGGLEGQDEELGRIRRTLRHLEVMVDQLYLGLMVHLPEPSARRYEAHLASAERRHGSWRKAVKQTAAIVESSARSRSDER